ncbi:MAG: ATP-dependent Clp protease proteolytic subunit [Hyphomicrobium sp.]
MLQAHDTRRSIWPILAALVVSLAAIIATTPYAHAAVGKLKLSKSSRLPDILVMTWRGEVRPGMAKVIRAAFDKYKDRFHVIELILDSPGGSVHEGEKVIAVLQQIKKTHRLITIVMPGKRCGSMCPFIYMQGQKRFAAPASIWLFHEVSRSDKRTHKIYELDRAQWESLIEKYWLPAGVNPVWIAEMKTHTFQSDYYQTGQDLLDHDSGIVHKPLSDEMRRKVVPKETAHQP